MATPTTPASTSAAPATQGTIVFVQGEAYLRDRQGKLQAIKPGDAVAEGQEIVTTAGAVVDVQLPSGAKLSIGPDRQVLLNDELFATSAPVGHAAAQAAATCSNPSASVSVHGTAIRTLKPRPTYASPSGSWARSAICTHNPQAMHLPCS